MEGHARAAERDGLAVADRLRRAGEILAVAQPHQVERLLRRQHRAVAGARVVGMAVRDQRLVDRPRRDRCGSRRACSTRRPASARGCLRDALGLRYAVNDAMTGGPLFVSSGDLIADRRYKWALDHAARGDLAGAADILAQTVELAPGFATAWFALGAIRDKLGDRAGGDRGLAEGARRRPRGLSRRAAAARAARRRRGHAGDDRGLCAAAVRSVCRDLRLRRCWNGSTIAGPRCCWRR